MSLFSCPKKSRKGRNNYRRVVHSISDSETDEQHVIESSGASDTARIEQPLDNASNKVLSALALEVWLCFVRGILLVYLTSLL